MRGIILAGGTGQRLDPLTRITNKHLLPVYDKPMIYYAVEQMAGAGLDRIMIVTGGNHAGEFLRLLGNGSAFGLRHLDYAYQDKAGGIAQALGLAEFFSGGEPVAVLLGDNIFEYSIAGPLKRFVADPRGARIILTEVDNASAYGVADMRDGKLVRILEKPAAPPSKLVVTGLYFYDAKVFDIVKTLKPSGRGELELTDVNNRYLELGELRHELAPGYWADCGESFAMLLRANTLVSQRGANKPVTE
jgi:glucose-1-phosphate thymidylyltransferase